MKKLILISALLLVASNGWAEDLICSYLDEFNDNWYEVTIKNYKATSGLAYESSGKLKRGIKIESDKIPTKYVFERIDKYWWLEYMLDAPHLGSGWFLNYDPERNILNNISSRRDYDICVIK